MLFKKLKKEVLDTPEKNTGKLWTGLGIAALYSLAGYLFFFTKRAQRPAGKKIDIELRYDTEKTADTAFLAQNLVKIIKIVLTPLESKISKEEAKLIFVFGNDGWEMRVRNGSDNLKHSVARLLEAREW